MTRANADGTYESENAAKCQRDDGEHGVGGPSGDTDVLNEMVVEIAHGHRQLEEHRYHTHPAIACQSI